MFRAPGKAASLLACAKAFLSLTLMESPEDWTRSTQWPHVQHPQKPSIFILGSDWKKNAARALLQAESSLIQHYAKSFFFPGIPAEQAGGVKRMGESLLKGVCSHNRNLLALTTFVFYSCRGWRKQTELGNN